MAYQSFKRVVGETSLEFKCLVAFGLTLIILLGAAFYFVYGEATRLVQNTTREAARNSAIVELFVFHWKEWDQSDRIAGPESDEGRAMKLALGEVRDEMINELLGEGYETEVLALDDVQTHDLRSAPIPTEPIEVAILERLRDRYTARQLQKEVAANARRSPEDSATRPDSTPELVDDAALPTLADLGMGVESPVFDERVERDSGKYYYYQVVEWKNGCVRCHNALLGHSLAASDFGATALQSGPQFRVMRVAMDYGATQRAIFRTQAVLWFTAIMTGFLSMAALYQIVKFVIVKPLRHLRDVADDISRGNTKQRAELHTNDEFQRLADAFNRMLRHLTDAQTELESVNRELDAKVDELAQLNMQLYEMNRLKDDFLANMSHELRTPLNSIIGFSEVLQGIESLDDRQRRYARNIQKSGRLLLDMINDILDLAKMEAGKLEVRLSEFRLDVVVGAQCDMVRSLVENKNLDLIVSVESDLPPLYQDQAKLQQILTNLLSNAIKFTPEGGRIEVRAVREPDGRLAMTVADTGVGIPESDREIIFEKFRQSQRVLGDDGLTREFSGTGLGLSIVKELCKLLGGEITFTSELGKGSVFKVTLPWSRPDRPRRDPETPSDRPAETAVRAYAPISAE